MTTVMANSPLDEGDYVRLLQALEERYGRTDRITGRVPDLRVRVLKDPDEVSTKFYGIHPRTPGWTDGKTIYLNDSVLRVGELSKDAIMRTLGVNYHELAHVLYTPSVEGDLARKVQANGMWGAFNALEDQRAEMLFTGEYGVARRFFTAACTKWLTATKHQWASNYGLVYGRKFLPRELTARFRERFAHPSLLGDVERIIDTYLGVVPDEEPDRAYQLVEEFHNLLNIQPPHLSSAHDGNAGPKRGNDAAPTDANEQRELHKRAEERAQSDDGETKPDEGCGSSGQTEDSVDASSDEGADAPGDERAPEGESDAAGDGGGAESEGEGGDGEPGDGGSGEASDEGEGGAGDGSDPDTSASEGPGGDGAGGGGAGTDSPEREGPDTEGSLDDLIDHIEDSLRESAEVSNEVKQTRHAVEHNRSTVYKPHGDRPPLTMRPLDGSRLAVINRVTRKLQDVRVGAESTFHKGTRHGRINPELFAKASLRADGDLHVFNEWEEGLVGDQGALEVVLMVDMSGSMKRSAIQEASFAAYALKRGFEEVPDCRVTLFAFDTEHYMVYGPDDKPDRNAWPEPRAQGGTNPVQTLREGLRLLGTSKAGMKMLVSLTDGQWAEAHKSRQWIRRANDAGIVTACIGLGGATRKYGGHGSQYARDISNPADLVDIATELATQLVTRAEREAQR